MEASESPIDQEIPESNTANDELLDGEEQKMDGDINEENNEAPKMDGDINEENNEAPKMDGAINENNEEQNLDSEINEENKDEMNNPQESRMISHIIMEEELERIVSEKELEEHSQNPDYPPDLSGSQTGVTTLFKQESQDRSEQLLSQENQRQSIGQYSLQSPKSLQEQRRASEADTKESRPLISRRPDKELQDKINQTSLIWEKKPLAEILHPSGKVDQISKDAEHDVNEGIDPVGDAEEKQPSVQESTHSPQPLEGEPPAAAGMEPDLTSPLMESKESESSPPMPGGQQPEEERAQKDTELSTESQPLESETPFPQEQQQQCLNETSAEEGGILISRKGKMVKSSFNQTSLIWEKKPLAQILQLSSTRGRSQEQMDLEAWFDWPSNWPSDWPCPFDY